MLGASRRVGKLIVASADPCRPPGRESVPTGELRSLQAPTLLVFGDRDFSPLADVLETFELLPNAQLAVLPATTHVGSPAARRSARVDHAVPRRVLTTQLRRLPAPCGSAMACSGA